MDKISTPHKSGEVKAPSFLTGFIFSTLSLRLLFNSFPKHFSSKFWDEHHYPLRYLNRVMTQLLTMRFISFSLIPPRWPAQKPEEFLD